MIFLVSNFDKYLYGLSRWRKINSNDIEIVCNRITYMIKGSVPVLWVWVDAHHWRCIVKLHNEFHPITLQSLPIIYLVDRILHEMFPRITRIRTARIRVMMQHDFLDLLIFEISLNMFQSVNKCLWNIFPFTDNVKK